MLCVVIVLIDELKMESHDAACGAVDCALT